MLCNSFWFGALRGCRFPECPLAAVPRGDRREAPAPGAVPSAEELGSCSGPHSTEIAREHRAKKPQRLFFILLFQEEAWGRGLTFFFFRLSPDMVQNLGLGAAPRCQSPEQAVAVVALLLPAAFPGHTETPMGRFGSTATGRTSSSRGISAPALQLCKTLGFCQGVHGEGAEGLVRASSLCCARRSSRCTHAEIGLVPVCTCAPCLCRLLAMGRVGVQGGVSVTPIWACKMGTKLWLGGTEP